MKGMTLLRCLQAEGGASNSIERSLNPVRCGGGVEPAGANMKAEKKTIITYEIVV